MQLKTITKQKFSFFVMLGILGMLTSCGSFQYAGYDNDGIYSSDGNKEISVEQPIATTSTSNSSYYENYFAEKAADLEVITTENEIFTNLDSYEGNSLEKDNDTLEQRQSHNRWGQNNNSITINAFDNDWYRWNDPWLWNRWRWNNWGWNAWCPPGYYNNWVWNAYYRNSNRFAYNVGRRGSLLSNNSLLGRNFRSNVAISRRNSSSRRLSNGTTRARRNTTGIRSNNSSTRRSNTRTVRPSNSNTRSIRSTKSTRSSGSIRSSRSSRSSSSSSRSSGGRRGRR